ncbi:metal-dependent hydrolase [Salimicrobium halophilum]|uniref:Inner membrane protein n=1 Tax=Salimicrobium halophilum TaxID=86666 RepID=A0A1G8VQR5_9BACI|nr:metal-dependent hydrolase [Salimicrobium halophilum]SDJ68411.1 inner membrane protein [Salimicrobium halophilum]
MMAPGHQVVGFSFGVAAVTLLPALPFLPERPLEMIVFFMFVLFGALVPDIDTPRSRLGQKFWRILITLFTIALGVYLFAPALFDTYREPLKTFVMLLLPILLMIRGHRKMTHSLFFLLFLVGYSYFVQWLIGLPWYYFGGLVTGAASHLFADFITKRGIPLFYPFSKKHWSFFVTFKTGSMVEKIVTFVLIIMNVWYLLLAL